MHIWNTCQRENRSCVWFPMNHDKSLVSLNGTCYGELIRRVMRQKRDKLANLQTYLTLLLSNTMTLQYCSTEVLAQNVIHKMCVCVHKNNKTKGMHTGEQYNQRNNCFKECMLVRWNMCILLENPQIRLMLVFSGCAVIIFVLNAIMQRNLPGVENWRSHYRAHCMYDGEYEIVKSTAVV